MKYYGKYRGKVLSTEDPLVSGRLLCSVAALPEMLFNWAVPCVPYVGVEQGFFALPPEGSDVWIEFERGEPDRPIWSGGYWEAGLEPLMPEISPEAPELVNVLRSKFCTLLLNDTPAEGGIRLNAIDPAVDVPVLVNLDSTGFNVIVGELSLTMNPEVGITLTAGESVLTLSAEGLVLETPGVDVTAEETVSVESPSTEIEGNVEVTGPVEVEGNVEITGATEIEGNVEITGAVEIEGNVEITGAMELEGATNIVGAVSIEGETNVVGALSVEGDANFLGAQQTEGNCAVAGIIEGIVVPPGL